MRSGEGPVRTDSPRQAFISNEFSIVDYVSFALPWGFNQLGQFRPGSRRINLDESKHLRSMQVDLKFFRWFAQTAEEWLRRVTKRAWTIDTVSFVPSDQKRFLVEDVVKFKWALKFLKRRLVMLVLGQEKRHLTTLPKRRLKILWINRSAPSIGDALMDLAGRVLLQEHELYLFGYPNYQPLFKNDRYIRGFYSEFKDLLRASTRIKFDLVMLDSFAVRSVIGKFLVAPRVPLVSLYGYLNGFEVHRTIYSFSRIAKICSFEGHFEPRPFIDLRPPESSEIPFGLPSNYYAVVVGAEWEFRNYPHWEHVIRALGDSHGIVLIGSENGSREAARLQTMFPEILNYVGKRTLLQTAFIVQKAQFVLAADGGLWHIACSLDKRSVALFADCELFDDRGVRTDRATPKCRCIALYGAKSVSEISPTEVARAGHLLLERYKDC